MTSTLLREKENSIRRETSLRLAEVLRHKSSIHKWLPLFEIELASDPPRKLPFVALDNRKKGKKRIYTTRGAIPNSNDLFIAYASAKDLKRFERNMGTKAVEMFVNRWVLTRGKPVTRITRFCELWDRFLAVEKNISKSNCPLEGSNTDIYVVNAAKLTDCSGSCPKIVCRLKRLHKGV